MRIKNPVVHVVLLGTIGYFVCRDILSPKGQVAFAALDRITRFVDNLLDGTTAPRSPAERSLTEFFASRPERGVSRRTIFEVKVGKALYWQNYLSLRGDGPNACAVFRQEPITLVAFYPEDCSLERTTEVLARQDAPPVKP